MRVTTSKRRSFLKGILMTALTLAVCLGAMLPTAAAAVSRIDLTRDASLSLRYSYEDTALSGVRFRLYQVADVSEDVRFTLSGAFKDYPVSLEGLDAAGWTAAANTLAVYADADKVAPRSEQRTDSAGVADFGVLPVGLYLLTAEDKAVDGVTYRSAPFLVSLPSLRADGETWDYHVTAAPKCTTAPLPVKNQITVLKVWNDSGHTSRRPDHIEAVLLRDGQEYDAVRLDADNFWRYTWTGLDETSVWSVVERGVPSGYSVTYTGSGTVIKITNTYPDDPGSPDGPDGPDDHDPPTEDVPNGPPPKGDVPHIPSTPNTPSTPDTPLVDIPDEDIPLGNLPQTGQLWWPVPVMAVAGLLLFSAGWFHTFRSRGKNR